VSINLACLTDNKWGVLTFPNYSTKSLPNWLALTFIFKWIFDKAQY